MAGCQPPPMVDKPPDPPTLTYAMATAGITPSPRDLQMIPLTSFRGEPAIEIPDDYLAVSLQGFHYALVGKFPVDPKPVRPPMDRIKLFFTRLDLKASYDVGSLDRGHVLIRLHSSEDYQRLWARDIWHVDRVPMKIFKWSIDFASSKESPIVPAWILLPGLPPNFFHERILFSIVQAIGKPLKMDHATANLSRPSVARVSAEVNLLKPNPSRIWVSYSNKEKGFWQPIDYEYLPSYCSDCCHFGHTKQVCAGSTTMQTMLQHDYKKSEAKRLPQRRHEVNEKTAAVHGSAADQPLNCKASVAVTKETLKDKVHRNQPRQVYVPKTTSVVNAHPFAVLQEQPSNDLMDKNASGSAASLAAIKATTVPIDESDCLSENAVPVKPCSDINGNNLGSSQVALRIITDSALENVASGDLYMAAAEDQPPSCSNADADAVVIETSLPIAVVELGAAATSPVVVSAVPAAIVGEAMSVVAAAGYVASAEDATAAAMSPVPVEDVEALSAAAAPFFPATRSGSVATHSNGHTQSVRTSLIQSPHCEVLCSATEVASLLGAQVREFVNQLGNLPSSRSKQNDEEEEEDESEDEDREDDNLIVPFSQHHSVLHRSASSGNLSLVDQPRGTLEHLDLRQSNCTVPRGRGRGFRMQPTRNSLRIAKRNQH